MNMQRLCWRRSLWNLPSTCRRSISQAAASQPDTASGPPGLFRIPALADDADAKANGIVDQKDPNRRLYSAFGFEWAWTQYQQRMLNALNDKLAERGIEGSIKDILIQTARDPAQAALFNHASMAFNNHIYFSGISAKGPVAMPEPLQTALARDFGSIDNLRQEMLTMAETMFGPGFVWLVRVTPSKTSLTGREKKFMLLPTYIAGSPLAGAHNRRQPVDMNTQNVENAKAAGGVAGLSLAEYERYTKVQNNVGGFGPLSGRDKKETSYGGVNVTPCLCVNTWEHAYVYDWRYNKRMFLERWWEFVNWETVKQLSGVETDNQDAVNAHRFYRR